MVEQRYLAVLAVIADGHDVVAGQRDLRSALRAGDDALLHGESTTAAQGLVAGRRHWLRLAEHRVQVGSQGGRGGLRDRRQRRRQLRIERGVGRPGPPAQVRASMLRSTDLLVALHGWGDRGHHRADLHAAGSSAIWRDHPAMWRRIRGGSATHGGRPSRSKE